MTSQLGNKRRFIDGRDDWRFQIEKAPVTTSADQFIQGQKVFNDPVTFYKDILCEGVYKGDGSYLTGIVPSTGGIMTGQLVVPSIRFNDNTIQTTAYKSLVQGSFSNTNIVVNSFGQIASITNGTGGGGGGPAYSIDVSPPTGLTGWFYPTFVNSSGLGQTLYCDNAGQELQYDPALGILKTTTFEGNVTGNASTASLASQVSVSTTPGGTHKVALLDTITGTNTVQADNELSYNSSTNTLTTDHFHGALTGNADTATYATTAGSSSTATVANTLAISNIHGNPSHHILFVDATSGNQTVQANTNLTYNTSTNTLQATTFAGALTGNVSGNVSGSSGSCTGNAATSSQVYMQPADNTSSAIHKVLFALPGAGAGNKQVLYDLDATKLAYYPDTNTLAATTFEGYLSGQAKYATVNPESSATKRKLVMYNDAGLSYNLTVDDAPTVDDSLCYDSLNNRLYAPNFTCDGSVLGTAFGTFVKTTGNQDIGGFKTFTQTLYDTVGNADYDNFVFTNNAAGGDKLLYFRQKASVAAYNPGTVAGDAVMAYGNASTAASQAIFYTLANPSVTMASCGMRLTCNTPGTTSTSTLIAANNQFQLDSSKTEATLQANGLSISNYTGGTSFNLYMGVANTSSTYGHQQIVISPTATVVRAKGFTTANAYNIMIGEGAGDNLNGGASYDCIAIGRKALGQNGVNLGGYNNIAIGKNTGYNLNNSGGGTTASNNTLIGANAGALMTSGENNTTLGALSGYKITTGDANFCLGYQAGYRVTDGGYNTFIGAQAGGTSELTFITGQHNVGIGYQSLRDISGSVNGHVGIGYQAGLACTSASSTMCIGYQAGVANTNQTFIIGNSTGTLSTGADVMMIGNNIGNSLIGGPRVILIGTSVGALLTGNNNCMIGYNIGQTVTTGTSNTMLGTNLSGASSMLNSVVIGADSGSTSLANANVIIGKDTATASSGNNNVIVGRNAAANAAGLGNVCIGSFAGADLTTGSNNVLIGGNNATFNMGTATESDTVRIGRQGVAKFYVQGSFLHRVITFVFNGTTQTLSSLCSLVVFRITAATQLNIPAAAASNYGTEIIFRKHIAAGNAFNLTVEATAAVSDFITPAGAASASLVISGMTARIVCTSDPSTPANYFWSILENA